MTRVIAVDPEHPASESIAVAADILRFGGLVAIPTETVYGLAANALDEKSVAKIFVAKGRPSNNPLIVHVADVAAARELTADWPVAAELLAARFWPGPLTLVLHKRMHVPAIVTAGGATVAIRIPRHPVALALLRATGFPLAAPSANMSNGISPTTAEHVRQTLDGRIDLILDAGPASGGIESTVIDLTTQPARLLRPGLITPEELEPYLGKVERPTLLLDDRSRPMPSPGTSLRHYAPRAVLECFPNEAAARRVDALCNVAAARNGLIGWLRIASDAEQAPATDTRRVSIRAREIVLPANAAMYARQLYAAMYELDATGVAIIVADLPPCDDAWLAVRDRLRRAATVWNE